MKNGIAICLILIILLQNSGVALFVFSHHHHCNTENKCATDEANCIPENDDCAIAKTVKDVAENEKKSDNKKAEINADISTLFCEEVPVNNFAKTFLDAESIICFGAYNTYLLQVVQTVLTPPPNIC